MAISTRHRKDLANAEQRAIRAYGFADLRARWLHDGLDTVHVQARTDSGSWKVVGVGRGLRAALRSAASTLATIAEHGSGLTIA